MEIKQVILKMREIEPNYKFWNEKEIENQIEAIFKCGYECVEDSERIHFIHKPEMVSLDIEGLDKYTPENIVSTFNSVWSKGFKHVHLRGKLDEYEGMLIWNIIKSIF